MNALSLIRHSVPTPRTQMELLADAYERYNSRLLGYISDRVPAYDWHCTEDLAQDTWLYVLSRADLTVDGVEPDSGLPVWLAATARTMIRSHLAPAVPDTGTNWAALTQTLGHAADWPAHWHEVLADEGQAALLRIAAEELAEDDEGALAAPGTLAA
ncbi:hypothetical protein [Streptomyces mangrovi]|uniref:hypothetical protein n=1 Tax=Streptomyces mangrovi TaxID=1206892 RepID=UPI00399C721D